MPDRPPVDRIPIGRSVTYAVRGLPDLPNQYGPGHLVPTEITLTYRSTEDSRLGRVHAYVKGRWRRDGVQEVDEKLPGQHYYGDTAKWPDWLAEEARLHDPAATADDVAHAIDNATPYPVELDSSLCRFMAERLLEMLAIGKRPEHSVWQPEEQTEPGEQPQPLDPAELRRMAVEAHGIGTQQPEAEAELDRLRIENARMRHELEVMYGGAFDDLKPEPSEAHRLALSEALHLGNAAPWDAILDRAGDLSRRDVEAQQPPAAEAPGPWVVQKICCGHDDGTPEFATWEAANTFRETYIDSARIAGHERSAIVRRKDAPATEQQPVVTVHAAPNLSPAAEEALGALVDVAKQQAACDFEHPHPEHPCGRRVPAPSAQQPATEPGADQGGALIEDYLKFLRGQGPEPDLSDLPAEHREAITGQFEIVRALADRDPELPPLEHDPVARRLGLYTPAVPEQPAAADTDEEPQP